MVGPEPHPVVRPPHVNVGHGDAGLLWAVQVIGGAFAPQCGFPVDEQWSFNTSDNVLDMYVPVVNVVTFEALE